MSARSFRRAREREALRDERRRANLAKRASLATGAAIGATVFFAPGAEAANFEVTTLVDAGAGSLRQAVEDADTAVGNDTITFQTGLTGTITLTSGEILINGDGNLDVQGPGENDITVSGDADSDGLPDFDDQLSEGDSRIFSIDGNGTLVNVAISGLTLSGGVASDYYYNPIGPVGPNFYEEPGGAVYSRDVSLSITDSTFSGNLAGGDGGGVYAGYGTLTLNSAVFDGNRAYDDGGGASAPGGVSASQSTFINNVAGGDPILPDDGDTRPSGGGLQASNSVNVTDSSFTSNSSSTSYYGYTAGYGGGLNASGYGSGSQVISNSTFTTNIAGDEGGGFRLSGTMSVTDSTITGNSVADAGGDGGGFVARYSVDMSNATATGNTADDSAGGVVSGDSVLSNSTVSGNDAFSDGGGVSLYTGGTLRNSTVSDNTALKGGGVVLSEDSRIENSTIADNTADSGGGVYSSTYTGEESGFIDSSVIADNSSVSTAADVDVDDGDPAVDVSFSLIESVIESEVQSDFSATNIIGEDPELGPLSDNGGPTLTHLPSDTSPLLDSGKASGLTQDQRGENRTVDTAAVNGIADATDIGAVEIQDEAATGGDDTTDPDTQINTGPDGTVTSNDVSFTFTAPGETGATFECSLDGAAFAPCTSPQGFTDLSEGDHVFQVRAIDSSGNVDDSPATRAFAVDTSDNTAPETSIDSGPAGTVNENDVSFTFSSPGEPSATFECSLDGAAFAACASPQDLTDLSDGAHSFQVRAVDAEGNKDADPATQAFNVDTSDQTDPETQIDTGPTGTVAPTAVSFTFSAPGETGATFECSLDGAAFEVCTSPKAYTGLTDGPHVFQVRTVDAAGNKDETPATRAFNVETPDTTAPATTLTDTPPNKVKTKKKKAKVTFEFTSDDPQASFECALDGAAFAACTSPFTEKVGKGAHTFQVRAVDDAGNADATPATFDFTVKKKKKKK